MKEAAASDVIIASEAAAFPWLRKRNHPFRLRYSEGEQCLYRL